MTATATIYTPLGFAIAADGWQRWYDEATRDSIIREAENEAAQKIFAFAGKWGSLAYLIRGGIANLDRSFDLGIELENQLALHGSKRFAKLLPFLQTISANLEHYIETAKRERRIDVYPATFIDFVGYFDGRPSWIEIRFLPLRNPCTGSLYEVIPREFYPGFCFITGSLIIRDLISQDHPKFSRFCKPFNPRLSLADAAGFVAGYIEACSSPEALEFDPTCEELGGHIHVATVTPDIGFEWTVAPIKRNR